MSAKATVTTSMIWVGVLVFVSQGWIRVTRDWIQKLSGTVPDEPSDEQTATVPWWDQIRKDEANSVGE